MTTIPQLSELKRRLHDLEMKKARYGINVPPEYSIESQDLNTVIGLMERIDIKRRNVEQYLKQRDVMGPNAPVYTLNSIINERADIVQLRQQCARYGQNVAEHPVDSEQVAELPEVRSAPRSDIRSKLDQIEVLLAEIRAALS